MRIRKQRHHFIAIAYPQAMRSFYLTLMLVFALLLPALSPAAVYVAGDLAPRGAPDGKLNVADIAMLQKFILGELTPTHQDILIGDVAPLNNPDGVLNVADMVVLMRAVQGAVSLPPVVVTVAAPVLDAAITPTNNNPNIVTGTAVPNVQVNLYSGNQKLATGTADANGVFKISAALSDGINQLYATAFDGTYESIDSNIISIDYQNTLLRNINSTNNNLTITSDTVWTPGSTPTPYIITGAFTVAAGATLTLQPGVTLQFGAGSQLLVPADATLIVQGTATNKVIFTSSGAKAGGGEWSGIVINSNSAQNLIEYADIRYADIGVRFNAGSRGEVHNSTIMGNNYGISVYGDKTLANNPVPVVTHNHIYNNGHYYRYYPYDYRLTNYDTGDFADAVNVRLNAMNNWWGDTDPAVISKGIYDQTDYAASSPVVDYSGFLDYAGNPVSGHYLNGTFASDTTLTAGTVYDALGDLHVPAGVTLTIEAGAQLRFADTNWNLIVDGSLVVNGVAGNEVVFTSSKSFPAAGNWGGIQVNSGATVTIDYAVIEYANYGVQFNAGSGGQVRNSTITANSYGIYVYGDGAQADNPMPLVTGNSIYDNGIPPYSNLNYTNKNYYATNFANARNVALNATGNWWGTANVSDIALRVYGYSDYNKSSPIVNYGNYLDAPDGNAVSGNYLYGQVSDATQALQANTDYIVISTLVIWNNTWTIPAGAHLLFTPGAGLSVDYKSNLVVNGVAGNKVVFTSSKPNPAEGRWGGIQVNNRATASIDYADIRYAVCGVRFNAGSGGQVRNSRITANSYGIYVYGDGTQANNPMPVVTGNRIYDNGIINSSRSPGHDYYTYYFANAENTVLNATGNWWGDTNPDVIAQRIYDYTDYATSSPVVDYSGFLDDTGNPVSGHYLNGTFASDTTLTAGTVYDALGDLHVPAGVTLTIEAGAQLRFADASWDLIVDGSLVVQGVAGNEVLFTSSKPKPVAGDWGGIQVNKGATVSINYADIRYAKYGVRFNAGSGGQVRNSRITANSYGIYVYGDGTQANDPMPVVTGNRIYDNGIINNIRYPGRDYSASYFANTENTVLNATGNWWGNTDPGVISRGIDDQTDYTTPSPVVDYSGFLDDAGNPVSGNYLNGTFASDTTLTAGTVYDLLGDVHVLAGVTLTIEAGAQLRFADASWDLIVDGSLVVQGVAGDEVLFTSTNATPAAGNWGGIQVNNGATVSINYADIRYAKYGVRFNAGSGGQVHNSTITANSYGIYVYGDGTQTNNPNPVVTGNSIYDNGMTGSSRTAGRDYYAYVFGEPAATVLTATGNWWGTADLAAIAIRIYDYTDEQTYAPIVNYADYLDANSGNAVSGNYLYGQVSDTTQLLQPDTTYTVISTLTVPTNTMWTVPAGTRLLFAANTGLTVNGNLVVSGIQGNEVLFSRAQAVGITNVPDWEGVRINAGGTVSMNYAIVEYAGKGIYFDSASGTVKNSLIRFNQIGIYITGASSPELTANRIVYNIGSGISIIGTNADATNPRPVITGNDIYGNGNTSFEIYVDRFGKNSTIVLDMSGNWWGTGTPVDGTQIQHGYNTPVAGSTFIKVSNYATAPLSNPVFSAFTISEPYISPNADGSKDATTISALISALSSWTLTITDTTNTVIRSFSGTGTWISQPWDGKNASGQTVADGVYRVVIQATDAATGKTAYPASGIITVNTVAPTAVMSLPSSTGVVSNTISINGTAKSAIKNGRVTYTVDYASTASPGVWKVIQNGTFPVVNGNLATWVTNSYRDQVVFPNGAYLIRLRVRDTSLGIVATDQIAVTLDNMLISNVVRTNDMINPSQNETATINFDINQSADVTIRIVSESMALKVSPDQTPELDAVRTIRMGTRAAGTQTVSWDGRDDAGNIVKDGAYIYVIEAFSSTGKFDKFNYGSFTRSVLPGGELEPVIDPGSVTPYNPYKNEFVSLTFDAQNVVFRGSFRVQYIIGYGYYTVYPVYQSAWASNSSTIFWDGRDENGNIITNIQSLNYYLSGLGDGYSNPVEIKSNYVLVQGSEPDVPGISLKSDPYIVYLSYGQVTQLKYTLADAANVTVMVKDPVTGVETVLLNNVAQTVGDHTVPWEGQSSDGTLLPDEGHYTFAITATSPVTGFSTVRRGNISVFQ